MKNCKHYLLLQGMVVKKIFKVPSVSEKGKFRLVRYFNDGRLKCSCPAGQMNRPCRHKQIVAKELKGRGFFQKTENASALSPEPLSGPIKE